MERRDEGKGERADVDRGQTQAGHKWDKANNSDDRDRPQMADNDDPDSQAPTNAALVARISYLSQDRLDLKFASMQVCCAMAKPTMRRHGTRHEDRMIPRWETASQVLVPLAAEW